MPEWFNDNLEKPAILASYNSFNLLRRIQSQAKHFDMNAYGFKFDGNEFYSNYWFGDRLSGKGPLSLEDCQVKLLDETCEVNLYLNLGILLENLEYGNLLVYLQLFLFHQI